MKIWVIVLASLSAVLLSGVSAPAETASSNAIAVDGNIKYVNYTAGDTINVTIPFTATCNVVFSGLSLRLPNGFTPRGVTGTLANVTGTPAPGGAATSGSVSFDLTFTGLKHAGKAKNFGMAHLSLVLGVDEDCNPATGDADGIDGSVTIPIHVSVSTASHP